MWNIISHHQIFWHFVTSNDKCMWRKLLSLRYSCKFYREDFMAHDSEICAPVWCCWVGDDDDDESITISRSLMMMKIMNRFLGSQFWNLFTGWTRWCREGGCWRYSWLCALCHLPYLLNKSFALDEQNARVFAQNIQTIARHCSETYKGEKSCHIFWRKWTQN